MTQTGRAYGGVPAQQRQAERRDRLVDAALEVIGSDGTNALTVHRVCRKAGLNERYFYESFRDRDQVITAVADAVSERLVTAILGALSSAADDPRALATAAIGAGVDLLADDRRTATLMLESAAHPILAPLRLELTQALVGLITEHALVTLHLDRTPAVEREATFSATMLLGGLIEVFSAWARGQLELSRDELVASCVETFLAVGDAVTTRTR